MDFHFQNCLYSETKPARQSQAACLLPGGLEGKRTLEIEKKKNIEEQKKKAN